MFHSFLQFRIEVIAKAMVQTIVKSSFMNKTLTANVLEISDQECTESFSPEDKSKSGPEVDTEIENPHRDVNVISVKSYDVLNSSGHQWGKESLPVDMSSGEVSVHNFAH